MKDREVNIWDLPTFDPEAPEPSPDDTYANQLGNDQAQCAMKFGLPSFAIDGYTQACNTGETGYAFNVWREGLFVYRMDTRGHKQVWRVSMSGAWEDV